MLTKISLQKYRNIVLRKQKKVLLLLIKKLIDLLLNWKNLIKLLSQILIRAILEEYYALGKYLKQLENQSATITKIECLRLSFPILSLPQPWISWTRGSPQGQATRLSAAVGLSAPGINSDNFVRMHTDQSGSINCRIVPSPQPSTILNNPQLFCRLPIDKLSCLPPVRWT